VKKFLILFLFIVGLFAKININTATIQELRSLKGIGEKKAIAIIEYRKKHPFQKVEGIMKVKGIGKKLFNKIKSDICVDCKEEL
jgi:competence protein ComEA